MTASTPGGVSRYRSPHVVGAVVIAALVVLAGCSGVLPAGSDDETDRTPYSVDEELEGHDDHGYDLAPGLTADGVENVSLLLEHHFEALERESGDGVYEAVMHSNRTENDTLTRETTIRVRTQYPDRRYESRTRVIYGDNATETILDETWADGTFVMSRSAVLDSPGESNESAPPGESNESAEDESANYDVHEASSRPTHPHFLESHLESTLAAVRTESPQSFDPQNVTVDERTRGSTTWYVVTGTRDYWNDDTVETTPFETTTLHIREDGFIQREHRSFVHESHEDSHTIEAQSHLEFDVRATESLERPDWYDRALETSE